MKPTARRITAMYSGASAVVAFVTQPVPALDELIVVPIHYRLCTRLARERGVPKKSLPWKQIRKIIWYGAGARLAANFTLGLVPVAGMFSNAVTAIALTEYLGHYIDDTLEHPDQTPPEVTMASLKKLFADALARHAAKTKKKKNGGPETETQEDDTAHDRAEDLEEAQWRQKVAGAVQGFRLNQVRDGSWFKKLLEQHAQKHGTAPPRWDALYPGIVDPEERADKHVKRVARKAAAAGAFASLGASVGELSMLLTDGLAAPIGIPAALASMVAEGAYTTLVQLDLASDLASIYGVPFGADVDEMSTLFALAYGADQKKKPAEAAEEAEEKKQAPHGLLARLMDLEDGKVATQIGKKLLEDAVLRNVVPVVGIGISARWNYIATKKFGTHVRRYVRYRRALEAACDKLRLADVKNPEVFVRGAWLLATCDGSPTREEMMAIARVLDQFPDAERQLPAFDVDDEEAWFERVARLPDETDERLIDLLSLVAAIDQDLAVAERRFLSRLGKTMKRPIDYARIEALCLHLREGEDLPDGFFGGAPPAPAVEAPAAPLEA